MIEPIKTRELYHGIQKIYRFPNNYGASVVRHIGSYGYEQGLWELAVIKYTTRTKWTVNYDTPITSDVEGHLTDKQVEELLRQIEALPGEE